jgi:hypothetical protein
MTIETLAQLEQRSGERGTIAGTYHQLDVRMKKHSVPEYGGHAAVRLADGTDVYLEPVWSPAAIRDEDERRRLSDARVMVTGVLHAQMPEADEPVAHLVGPCVSPVERIELG